jgi:hypothetical protein
MVILMVISKVYHYIQYTCVHITSQYPHMGITHCMVYSVSARHIKARHTAHYTGTKTPTHSMSYNAKPT